MSETLYRDIFGHEIVLTDAVRAIILQKHPETGDLMDLLPNVLANPDEIRQSIRDERVVLYYHFEVDVFNGKWLVVVIKRIDRHFIATFYATDQIKSGELLWKKTS